MLGVFGISISKYRREWYAALLGLFVIVLADVVAAQEDEEPECLAGQYIIEASVSQKKNEIYKDLAERASREDLVQIGQSSGAMLLVEESAGEISPDQADIVDDREGNRTCRNLRKLYREAKQRGEIARNPYCVCNDKVEVSATPNDPSLGSLWGLHQSNDIDIDAPEAWDKSTGNSEVVVGVIDTGIDYNHPDLADNMWRNPGEIAGDGIDNDGNGVVDDVHGLNAITGTAAPGNPWDDHAHGTHCAGTIGGRGNNGLGVAGVNWNVKLMALKFLSSSGSGSSFDAMKAVDYANNMRAKGVNIVLTSNSWGGGGYNHLLYEAIRRSRDHGILFVAAAGNSNLNNDTYPHYPSSYDLENVISVASLDRYGNRSSFSNYGVNTVDIAAPGSAILSTVPNGGYATYSGTSMATPHVSGALALLAGYRPGYYWDELKSILYNSSVPLSSLNGLVANSRFLNVNNMLIAADAAPPTRPAPTPFPTSTPTFTPTPRPTSTPTPLPTSTPTPLPTATPMPPPYTILGKVSAVDQNGVARPIAGAEIRLQFGSLLAIRVTDERGYYSFTDTLLSQGNFSLEVRTAGYNFSPRSGFITGSRTENFSASEVSATLSGIITTTESDPVADATVKLGHLGQVNTDSSGRFSLTLPIGTAYQISSVNADGYLVDTSFASGELWGDTDRLLIAFTDPLDGLAVSNVGAGVKVVRTANGM